MWTKYFKIKGLVPGRVVTHQFGEIDFSRNDVPVKTCQALYEADFPYLEITEVGKEELYGEIKKESPPKQTSSQKRTNQKKKNKSD